MAEIEQTITEGEKIDALLKSVVAAYFLIPILALILFFLRLLGFPMAYKELFLILFLGSFSTLLQHYFIKRKWLIDLSYNFLNVLIIGILVLLSIIYTGFIMSPIIWLGLLSVILQTVNYGYRRGIAASTFYIISLWGIFFFELSRGVEPVPAMPAFSVHGIPGEDLIMLAGYTMMYIFIPLASGYFSDQLLKEKRQALLLAEKNEKAYRASLSILEDLVMTRGQLESKVREIKEAHDELERIDRKKTEFLSIISHELRTPLVPIIGYSDMLVNGAAGELSEKQKQFANSIKKESDYLLDIVESVLDASRIEGGRPLELNKQPVFLRNLAEELLAVLKPQYEAAHINMKDELPENLPVMDVDPVKIKRALSNLITNAIKFTPENGTVRITGGREGDFIKLQVIDNGVGIAKENLGSLFRKYVQIATPLAHAKAGVGLGLSIVKGIIEAHGGKVWAESEGPGKGTKFIFTLPIE